MSVMLALPAAGEDKSKVDELKKHLSVVRDKKSALRKQIRKKSREQQEARDQIRSFDRRLTQLENQLEVTSRKVSDSRTAQKRIEDSLTVITDQLVRKQVCMSRRLRCMYTARKPSLIRTLLLSKNLGDLAARKAVMQRIAKQDRDLVNQIKELQKSMKQKLVAQESLVHASLSLLRKQKQDQDSMEGERIQKSKYLASLNTQQAEMKKRLDEMESESQSLAEKIRKYAAQIKGTGKELAPYTGGFVAPVPGSIGSGFGWRHHPVLKKKRFHAGVDIAAPHGRPIKAVAPGTVIEARWRGGYGNMVLIDHGGGISTLYGHCSRLLVSSGQNVQQGQVIAHIGSTGLATGPHLHFEVRQSGTPVDPRGYL